MPIGSPPLRVDRDKNLPDIVPTYTSNSDDKGEKNQSNWLVVACPRPIVVPLKAQSTPLPPITGYRNYITQDKDFSPPLRNSRLPKHHFEHHGQSYVILLPNVPHVIPNRPAKSSQQKISLENVLRNGRSSIGWGNRRFIGVSPPLQTPQPQKSMGWCIRKVGGSFSPRASRYRRRHRHFEFNFQK